MTSPPLPPIRDQQWDARPKRSATILVAGHLILALSAAIGLAVAMACRFDGDRVRLLQWKLPLACKSREALGVDCPACGMTRGVVSIAHGQLCQGLKFNPAAAPLMLLLVIQPPARVWALWRLIRGHSELPIEIVSFWIALSVLLVMIAHWGAQWFSHLF